MDQFFIRQTDSISIENLLFSVVSFSHQPKKKKQHVGTCSLQSFIISLVWWRWCHCRATWLRLHDHLRCKITGLAPRDSLNASLPLFLLCRPLRCLTFTADSIIIAAWKGIKRDVACSFSHLLNIQLHCMGHLKRTRQWLDSRDQSESAWFHNGYTHYEIAFYTTKLPWHGFLKINLPTTNMLPIQQCVIQ